jgi:hypothetical protein
LTPGRIIFPGPAEFFRRWLLDDSVVGRLGNDADGVVVVVADFAGALGLDVARRQRRGVRRFVVRLDRKHRSVELSSLDHFQPEKMSTVFVAEMLQIQPGSYVIKLLRPYFTDFRDKLECLALVSLSSQV